jgi:hypothetical protein
LLKATLSKSKVKGKDDPRWDQQLFGQLVMMLMTAHSRRYDKILHDKNILVSNTPSWSAIKFSENPSEIECARHLAARGVSPDELATVYQYATSWLQDAQPNESNMQRHIAISRIFKD